MREHPDFLFLTPLLYTPAPQPLQLPENQHSENAEKGVRLSRSEVCAYLMLRCPQSSLRGVRLSQVEVCAHLKLRAEWEVPFGCKLGAGWVQD